MHIAFTNRANFCSFSKVVFLDIKLASKSLFPCSRFPPSHVAQNLQLHRDASDGDLENYAAMGIEHRFPRADAKI
jgi:hypothetical protein